MTAKAWRRALSNVDFEGMYSFFQKYFDGKSKPKDLSAEKNATVFDVRPAMEFATSHIPGAVNVAQKPGTSKALYVSDVAEISRLLGNDKAKPVVLYCNGPFCGKSKRVSEDLLAAGFTNVKRYQLGIPVWRALGGVTQIERCPVCHAERP